MIWVFLWAGALIAFLYYFFGRRWLYVLLFPIGLIAIIATIVGAFFLQDAFLRWGYGRALEVASRAGWIVLIAAVTGLVGSLAIIVTCGIRYGVPGEDEGTVVTENRPMTMSPGSPRLSGRSKRKILVSREKFVSPKSLVDGTATTGERTAVLGIVGAMTSLLFVFVGAALIIVKTTLLGPIFVLVPAVWFARIARASWRDLT
jgi:hypothetical protein